jgi:DNA-directed RNA polymerase specialized sigma24 family protein
LLRCPPPDPAPDGELLAEYLGRRDPVVFERLVLRHAGTVWAVCRRVAGHEQDAEDAFQATFLVLSRAGRSIVRAGSLAEWLYGVAFRTAAQALGAALRRIGRPGPASPDACHRRPARRVTRRERLFGRLLDRVEVAGRLRPIERGPAQDQEYRPGRHPQGEQANYSQ